MTVIKLITHESERKTLIIGINRTGDGSVFVMNFFLEAVRNRNLGVHPETLL